ncbi:MAG TPA: hypothetical protein VEP69_01630, partial [Thermodesulfovibrionales bacterium]|nr:hypothetical protein [Thermodesulfovibrionales bacterium]
MNDRDKTKEELIRELSELRRQNAVLTSSVDKTGHKKTDTDLKSALAAAVEAKARTEAIIAALGDAVSIQDTDFRILYQNEVSKAIYGDHAGEY